MTEPTSGAPVTPEQARQAQAAIGRLVRYALHHG